MAQIWSKPCQEPNHDEGPRTVVFNVPAEAIVKWNNGRGAFVQDAFPMLSADDRERLVTGICGPCWERLFAGM